jgi:hypothetical protein
MRRLLLIATALLISCGAGHAQNAMSMPAIGPTSPLGSSGSMGTGLPLGATEVDPGGLSPATSTNCGASGAGSGLSGTSGAGTTSTFDGGGLSGSSTIPASGCTSSQALSVGGTASPLSNPSGGSIPTLNGGAIPLGATEINSGGISPMITVPGPSGGTPCLGSTTTVDSSAMSGSASNGVDALAAPSSC